MVMDHTATDLSFDIASSSQGSEYTASSPCDKALCIKQQGCFSNTGTHRAPKVVGWVVCF